MELNARMLLEALQRDTEVRLLGPDRPELGLHFPCFYDGDPESLIPGGVYLTEDLPGTDAQVLWVVWGPEEPESPRSLLWFPGENRAVAVFNRIHRVFLRFQLWEELTARILREDNSVKRLIEASEEILPRPLCAVDASLNHIGYSTSFLNMGFATFFPEEKKKVAASALFCEPHGYTMSPLGDREGSMGAIYMLENGVPFTYTEMRLFRQLTDKINQALHNMTMMSGLYQNGFKQNMVEYFKTGQVDKNRLFESLCQWGGQKGDVFECYKVKASHLNQKVNADYICSIFENVLYATVAFWHNGVMVVLVDVTRNGCDTGTIHGKMVELVRQLSCRAGVSTPFTDLDRAWYHFRQACCAFEEGYPDDRDLYFFRDYMQSYILHHALGEFPVSDLLDSGLLELMEHDRLYSVSYLDTLRTYFRCEMNISRTADALGIHRTSLNSRIQKIFDMLDHPMDDGYLLYLQIILAILPREE